MGLFKSIGKIFGKIGKVFRNILGDTGFQIFNIVLAIVGLATGNWWIIGASMLSSLSYSMSIAEDMNLKDSLSFLDNHKELRFGKKETVPVAYGLVKTGVNIVYADTEGKNNEKLKILAVFGENGDIKAFEINKLNAGVDIRISKDKFSFKGKFEYFVGTVLYHDKPSGEYKIETNTFKVYYDGKRIVNNINWLSFSHNTSTDEVQVVSNDNNKEILYIIPIKALNRFYHSTNDGYISLYEVVDNKYIKFRLANCDNVYGKDKSRHTSTINIIFNDGTTGQIKLKKCSSISKNTNDIIYNISTGNGYFDLSIQTTKPIVDIYITYGNFQQGRNPIVAKYTSQGWKTWAIDGVEVEYTPDIPSNINYSSYGVIWVEMFYKYGYFDEFNSLNVWIENGSQNPVDIIEDVLNRAGIDNIDNESFNEVKNYCNSKGIKISAVYTKERISDILKMLVNTFKGYIYEQNGLVYLKYCDINNESIYPEEILDLHIEATSLAIKTPKIKDLPEKVNVAFINFARGFSSDKITISTDDVNTSRELTIKLPAIHEELASEIGTYLLERQHFNTIFSFILPPDFIDIPLYGLIKINTPAYSMNGIFRVIDKKIIDNTGRINISVVPEDKHLYNKTVETLEYNIQPFEYETGINCIQTELTNQKIVLKPSPSGIDVYNKFYFNKKYDDSFIYVFDKDDNTIFKISQKDIITIYEKELPVKDFEFLEAFDQKATQVCQSITAKFDNLKDYEYYINDNLKKNLHKSFRVLPELYDCKNTPILWYSDYANFPIDTGDLKKYIHVGKDNNIDEILTQYGAFVSHNHAGGFLRVENGSSKLNITIASLELIGTTEDCYKALVFRSFANNLDKDIYTVFIGASHSSVDGYNSNNRNLGFVYTKYNTSTGKIELRVGAGQLNSSYNGWNYFYDRGLVREFDGINLNHGQVYFYRKQTGTKYRAFIFLPEMGYSAVVKWGSDLAVQKLAQFYNFSFAGFYQNYIYYYNKASGTLGKYDYVSLSVVKTYKTNWFPEELQGKTGSIAVMLNEDDGYPEYLLFFSNGFQVAKYNLRTNEYRGFEYA